MEILVAGTRLTKQELNRRVCIRPDLPRAKTAVFELSETRGDCSVSFKYMDQDDERPVDETGYFEGAFGDSGAAWFKYGPKQKRTAIILAVHEGSWNPRHGYMKSPQMPCRMEATKVSADVIQWIKDKSSIGAE